VPERRRRGHTLAELLIVCAVLAVAVAVALPSAQPAAEFRADAAASEVVQALRFARQEAMRTNDYRMLACDLAKNQLSVTLPGGSAEDSNAPTDPLTKMSYKVVLGQAPAGSNATLRACSFKFADSTSAATLGFDANGNPVRGSGASAAQALTGGTILVTIGNATRTITIDANARVTSS
jgi:Tfp pilus assembly protein FimT